ncbi:RNA-dependent RNA polymerase [Fitzroy Crossing tenui-like virus 1]|uniref:RNA-directed RNA polymerase L n=1 Tax=Fitzroy Crossing tenui-like virus 1 TaxID=2755159 RepID=A0A7D5Y153_9VIRU|nr:RNA-dependent RNA polymerase [Fitzroy Crossing tenui-like virus 1]QLJ83469.1 RNA-dependent RNA polymerase [Fitzroy Crossing tenui-like virus 1]
MSLIKHQRYVNQNLVEFDGFDEALCNHSGTVYPVAGDGNCLYHSISYLLGEIYKESDRYWFWEQGINLGLSGNIINELKEETLKNQDGTYNWGGEAVLIVFSFICKVNICVHKYSHDGNLLSCVRFVNPCKYNRIVHFRLSVDDNLVGSHFEPYIIAEAFKEYLVMEKNRHLNSIRNVLPTSTTLVKHYIFSSWFEKDYENHYVMIALKLLTKVNRLNNISSRKFLSDEVYKMDTYSNICNYFNMNMNIYGYKESKKSGIIFMPIDSYKSALNFLDHLNMNVYFWTYDHKQMGHVKSLSSEKLPYNIKVQDTNSNLIQLLMNNIYQKFSNKLDKLDKLNTFKNTEEFETKYTSEKGNQFAIEFMIKISRLFNLMMVLLEEEPNQKGNFIKLILNARSDRSHYDTVFIKMNANSYSTVVKSDIGEHDLTLGHIIKTVVSERKMEYIEKFEFSYQKIHDYLNLKDPEFPQTIVYESPFYTTVIDVDLLSMEKSLIIKFKDKDKSPLNMTTDEIEVPIVKFKNFVHDFTFANLVDQTDITFASIGLGINDSDDNKSPDYMLVKNRKLIVVEFTTRKSSIPKVGERAVQDKKLKYIDMVAKRVKLLGLNSYSYYVICVTPTEVISNLVLPEKVRNEMVYRYILANKIHTISSESGKYLPSESQDSEKTAELKQYFYKIEMPTDDHWAYKENLIDEKLINNCTRTIEPHDCIEMEKLVSWALQESKQRLILDLDTNCGTLSDSLRSARLRLMDSSKIKLKNLQDGIETRIDMKAPIQVPFFLAGNYTQNFMNDVSESLKYSSGSNAIERLWINAFENPVTNDMSDIISEVERLSKSIEEQEVIDAEQKKYRKYYGRHKIYLSSSDSISLAKIGFNGKRYKDDYTIREYRNQSKRPFDLIKTSTNDIEEFLCNSKDVLYNKKLFNLGNSNNSESIQNLLKLASSIHRSRESDLSISFVEQFSTSYMGKYCRLISDIATELSLSLKQHCSNNQVIIKQLRHFNVILLIEPTSLNNKLFYSILWEQSGEANELMDNVIGNIFKAKNKLGKYFYSDMISCNISKLVNLVRCESVGLANLAFWLEFFNISFCPGSSDLPALLHDNKESNVLEMWWFSIFILLNDKHTLEELITMTRFIHMESAVVFPQIANPSKMIEKISPMIRSRLEVYVIRGILQLIEDYTINHYVSNHLYRNGRIWKCFKNPFLYKKDSDLKFFENQDQMLSSCYLGYTKNKDEDPEANSSGQLCDKIVSFEDQIPINESGQVDRTFLGRDNPDPSTIRKHEFNTSFLKHITHHFGKKIRSKTGMNYKEYFSREYLRKISHQYLDTFSTLKATSNFGPEWYAYVKEKVYHRSKVIEKVVEILNSEEKTDINLVVDLMRLSLDTLERDGGLHICIFKKNQHGGLREIYVLTIHGRIIQKMVEDMARVVLNEIPFEIMTHPKGKFSIPEKHNTAAKIMFNNKYRTHATSDDAAKWNQGHYVSKFMILLCSLYPPFYHGFIIRSLSLWLNKKIKIPDDLLRLMSEVDQMNTKDEIVQSIFENFKNKPNRRKVRWMEPGTSYFKTETGMMQGILHYTSSLMHALFLLYYKDLCSSIINEKLEELGLKNQKCIIDPMVSSDDSCVLISIPEVEDNHVNLSLKYIVNACFEMKTLLANQLAIYRSVKSTTNTIFLMEFNSEFCFYGDNYRPTYRWVNACFSISEQENLMSRQEEMYNLVTNVVEGGGTLFLSHICQLSQGLLHYRMLGSSVSEVWPLYVHKIMESMDPALGFFLVDHPLSTGIAGLSYLVWLVCRMTTLGVKYKKMYTCEIEKTSYNSIKEITLENTTIGLFSRSTQISYGSNKRWKSIMESFDFDDSMLDDIDKDPKVLYVKPTNTFELKLKLYVKMKNPGVISSLGKNNALPRIIASSVYILSRPVLHSNSSFYRKELNMYKISLLSAILLSDSELSNIDSSFIPERRNLDNFDGETISTIDKTPKKILNTLCLMMKIDDETKEQIISGYHQFISFSNHAHHNLKNISNYMKINIHIYKRSIENLKFVESFLTFNSIKDVYFVDDYFDFKILDTMDDIDSTDNEKNKFTPLEERVIFHNVQDYEAINSILNSLSLGKPNRAINHRRRQRSTIQVTGGSDSSIIKMEEILTYFWFGMQPRYSYETLKLLFDGYQAAIPWLTPDIDETLKKSPFSNHIQLQNFISRQDRSNRLVHLVGSYGKIRHSKTSMASIIRNNYSNGLIFHDIYNINSRQRVQDMNVYLHSLSLLSLIPYDAEFKEMVVLDLLSNGPEISSSNTPNSKISKLSIIQDFVKNNPSLKINMDYDLRTLMKNKITNQIKSEYSLKSVERKMLALNEEMENEGYSTEIPMEIEEFIIEHSLDETTATFLRNYNMDETTFFEDTIEELTDDDNIAKLLEKTRDMVGTNGLKMFLDNKLEDQDDYIRKQATFDQRLPNIFSRLQVEKLGIIGFYTQSQKYDKDLKKYKGPGIWKGRFDNVRVEIKIDSDSNNDTQLLEVIISTMSEFENTKRHLRNWCLDNQVGNEATITRRNINTSSVVSYYCNFEEKSERNNRYCPFYMDNNLVVVNEYIIDHYRIELSDRSLRLKGYYIGEHKSDPRYVTIIYVNLNSNHVMSELNELDVNNYKTFNKIQTFATEWMLHKKGFIGGYDLVNNLHDIDYVKALKLNSIETKTWIKNLWEYKMSNLKSKHPINIIKEDNKLSNIDFGEKIDFTAEIQKFISEINSSKIDNLHQMLQDIVPQDYLDDLLEDAWGILEKPKELSSILEYHPYLTVYFDKMPVEEWLMVDFYVEQYLSGIERSIRIPHRYKDLTRDILNLYDLTDKTPIIYSKQSEPLRRKLKVTTSLI